MKNSMTYAAVCCALFSTCVGCASTSPTTRLYTLHSDANMVAAEPVAIDGGLGVGPVELPELVYGDGIVSLSADQQVLKSQSHLWAGDLKKAISRTVAANLSQQLVLDNVWPFPWDTRNRPEKQVSLFVEQLNGRLGGELAMVVKWTLFDAHGTQVVETGRQQFTASTVDDSYASYVAAINDLINQSSLKLASEVREHWGTVERE